MKGSALLTQAVRPRVVLKYFGQLSLSLVGMIAAPLLAAVWFGDFDLAARCAISAAFLLGLGMPLARLSAPRELQVNEALCIVTLTFMEAALAMTWPFMASMPTFLDALFEATSAITTTGLSALASVEGQSNWFLLTRAWLQWYGGLAIVVLGLALLRRPGAVAKRLAASDAEAADMVAGTRVRAHRVLTIYTILTAICFAILLLLGVPSFPAAVHALAGVSTGGFSSYDDSLGGLGGWGLQAVVISFSLFGAISFSLYYRTWHGGVRVLLSDRELLALLVVGLAVTAGLGVSMSAFGGRSWAEALAQAPILALSAQTTAGFTPVSVAALDPGSKAMLVLAMVIGGDAGSTAGGIKILRFLIVLRLLHLLVLRAGLPAHAVTPVRVAGRRLEYDEVQAAVSVVLIFAVAIIASWLPFVVLGYDALDSLFDVVSAFGTVGLSTGVAGPALEPLLKAVLCADMLMGRLEIVAVLVLFHPRTWFGRGARGT